MNNGKVTNLSLLQKQKAAQQAQPTPLEQEAGQLLSALEQLNKAEATNKSQYVGSYANMVSDVAKKLFIDKEGYTAETAIEAAIAFSEAFRVRIHDYSMKVLADAPVDPTLTKQREDIIERIEQLKNFLNPAEPSLNTAETSGFAQVQEEVHAATSSGPVEAEDVSEAIKTPEQIENV